MLATKFEEMKKSLNKKEEELFVLTKTMEDKEKEYNKEIEQCNDKISNIYREEKIQKDKANEKIGQESRTVNNLKDRLKETDNVYRQKFENEVQRGKKINENLDLIMKKIENFHLLEKKVDESHQMTKKEPWNLPKFKEVSSLEKIMDQSQLLTSGQTKAAIKLDLVLFESTNKGKN